MKDSDYGKTRVRLPAFGVEFDIASLADAADQAIQLTERQEDGCSYIVTPNVDHIITLRSNAEFRDAYAHATRVFVDGWPVAKALSVLYGSRVETVPGSDLVPAIFQQASRKGLPLTVFLLGAGPGVAEAAGVRIERRWPGITVVGTYSPPFGFENDPEECQRICEAVRTAAPRVLVIGLGAPKQELWIYKHRHAIGPCLALCAGATIDFMAEAKSRAPYWVRRVRMEWLYRALSEPRRLIKRYVKGLALFPLYFAREWISRP